MLISFSPGLAATNQVRIVLYADDGFSVLNETTVDYRWMEANLPVRGDGITHYYVQGPVFVDDPEERWNPEEDANVLEKDMGAVKGTDLRDLCDLVGGMEPGDTVTIRASDGFSKNFAYENVYEPSSRQGTMVIAWYEANQSYVPGYADGMRLIFFADTSTNKWGIHAMGNYDWHESAEEEYWHYYYQDGQAYPTTTGLTVRYISEIKIWSSREPKGSIAVTSNPVGARVFLDDIDTGYDTPCTIGDLCEGYYTLTVRKSGFATPHEKGVEVIAGKTVTVSFELEAAVPGGGYSGSGEGGMEGLIGETYQEVLSGGQLSPAGDLQVMGVFVPFPSVTDPFSLKGGEKHSLTFDVGNSSRQPTQAILYLFLGASSASPGISTRPDLVVSAGSGEIAPARSYSEEDDDGRLYATTLVYSLPEWNETGAYPVRSRNQQSWNTTVTGALLIAGFEDDPGTESLAWICEGADLLGTFPGREPQMTLAEFGSGVPIPALENATILTATTPGSAKGNLSFYVNGIGMPARIVSGDSPVVVCEISGFPVPAPAGIRLHITTTGAPVTNRVAVLMAGSGPTPPAITSPAPEITATVRPVTTRIPGTGVPEPAPGEIVPGGAVGRDDPVGNFLCWLLNLFLWLTGQPAEPCHQGEVPEIAVQDTTDTSGKTPEPSVLKVSSIPDMAMVFIDNQPTGLSTPCEIDALSGELHLIRIEKEGFLPFSQHVNGSGEIEAVLTPVPVDTGAPETPAPAPARSRHGGIFVHTYPKDAEIRIDGVVVAASSPLLLTPLKEGFHTVTAGISAGGNTYSSRQTIRTWVFPDAVIPVEFNLMQPAVVYPLDVRNDSRSGAMFTVDGYYPVRRVPDRIEFTGYPAFITITDGSSYLSFTIPPSSLDGGQFIIPRDDPPVCNLSIVSVPDGAEIFLDGIRTGLRAPATIPNVSAGYHRISISAPDRFPVTRLINIAESQCITGIYYVRYPLEWYASGSLNLTSVPPGADVIFRGLKTGEVTPCTLEGIPLGVWEITLTHGKDKRGIDAIVEPGRTRSYSVRFG
jgi:hypothetical protein